MKTKRRVVVTGIGAVTPLGVGVEAFAAGLRAGRSGIRLLRQLDTALLPTKGGGEVPDLPGTPGVPRFVQFAEIAFREAWEMAGQPPVEAERLGVLLGTSRGVVRELELLTNHFQEKGASGLYAPEPAVRELLAMLFPTFGAGVLSSQIARLCGANGPVQTISAACASGTAAIGEAAQHIREGRSDVMVAGGAEAPFTPTSFAGVCSSKAMSERWEEPTAACRPFDAERDGYVMGEGAGVLVLEAEEHARARRARILGEVVGYAQTDDASHITVPSGRGLRTALREALRDGGVGPEEIDYINAHGTSTLLNDRWETWAVKEAFGRRAERIPISSTKSMTGHLLGAAGAVEAIACLLAMQGGFLPPTINLRTSDPDCDLDYVPNRARAARPQTVLTQSLGFGGHNAAVILRVSDKNNY